ncbi:MAG: type II secretion system F family protein [Candidatus Nanoarchaeia archaeon]
MKDKNVLIICIVIAVILFSVGILLTKFDLLIIGYLGISSLMIVLFPYTIIVYLKQRKAKMMEDYFPQFLRDIAEAKRAGMTIPKAIELSAENDYGPLTAEVIKVRNHLSWGIPFPQAMKMLADRIEYSTYIKRGLAILLEAYFSGGRIADTMEAVGESTRQLKEVEKERESTLQQQLVIVYLIHFIFVGILVALYRILIPLLTFQGGGSASLISNFGAGEAPPLDFYKLLFFLTMTIQSFSNGLVAGVTKEGSLTAGIKHAGIMVTVSLFVYTGFIFPKLFTINVISSKGELTTNEPIEFYGSITLESNPISGAELIINFGGVVAEGFTDEYGDFNIKMRAPTVAGNYNVLVEARYESFSATSSISAIVK